MFGGQRRVRPWILPILKPHLVNHRAGLSVFLDEPLNFRGVELQPDLALFEMTLAPQIGIEIVIADVAGIARDLLGKVIDHRLGKGLEELAIGGLLDFDWIFFGKEAGKKVERAGDGGASDGKEKDESGGFSHGARLFSFVFIRPAFFDPRMEDAA